MELSTRDRRARIDPTLPEALAMDLPRRPELDAAGNTYS